MTCLTLSFSVRIQSFIGLYLEFDHLVSEAYRVEMKTCNESLNNKSCGLNVNPLLLQSVTRLESFMVYFQTYVNKHCDITSLKIYVGILFNYSLFLVN
jgi:hypothetical protein